MKSAAALFISDLVKERKESFSAQKIFLSAYICNVLEMYDFLITGMMFPYISSMFFPLENKISVLLAGSLTFFVGFLMRPIGAILFGHIGDTYGRKRALLLSIFGMSIATLSIGILPTYERISICAPILFVFLRLLQGLCLGGEGQGANVFILEHYRGINPGSRGGLLATSNGVAALIAFFVSMAAASNFISEDGWRLCYLFGATLGIVGLYLRTFIDESPVFLINNKKTWKNNIPLIKVLKERKIAIINIILCVGVGGALTYTSFTFINLFLTQFMNFSPFFSLSCAAFSTLLSLICVAMGGVLCDRVGLYPMLKISLISTALLVFPFHILLASNSKIQTILSLFFLAIPTGGMAGILPHLIASSFPTSERYTGAAFSNNLAQAIMGGIQPFIAIYLIKESGLLWVPACYTCFLALLCLLFFSLFEIKLKRFNYMEGGEK